VNVLVMGGTQFNGLALVHELARAGHRVTILNRGQSQAPIPHGVERLVADRTKPETIRAALTGRVWDAVVDVSAYRPEDVELMGEILHGNTGHYVFISSTVIYAPSDVLPIREDAPVDRSERQNEYGLNKILCEDHLLRLHRERGFPATTVALSMVFGPNNILPDREQRMFARLLRGREVLIPGDGTSLAQIGHVEDQARALRLLLGEPVSFGRRYNLTGADAFSAEGYVDTFAGILGVEARKVFVPPGLMDDLYAGRESITPVRVSARADTRGTRPPDPLQVNRFMLSMLVQRIAPHLHHWNKSVVFGIDRLRKDVAFEPAFSFAGAVADTWDWFRRERIDEKREFDFTLEDELLAKIAARSG